MAGATRDTFLDAITESYDALLSAVEATEARGHNVSRTVLEEARKGEKELVDLARKWADSPTSFFENFMAMLDAQTRAQRRALELARDSLTGAAEYRAEVQEALQRVIKANRATGEATLEVARDALSSAVERVRGTEEEEEEEAGGAARRRPARATKIPVSAGDTPPEAERAQETAATA